MKTQTIWKWTVAAAAVGAMQGNGAEIGTMRPLSTDRPDTTESPHTVDKGRFQIELEIGDDEFQGGVIIPFAFAGSGRWSYGVQVQFDLVADPTGSGHNFAFLTSATAARALTERLGVFFEVATIHAEGTAATSGQYFNSGLTWAVFETVQLDGGAMIGLSNDAEDFSPTFGISTKF